MQTIKLRKIGTSVGIILPKEYLDNLNVSEGDNLFVNQTKDAIELSPYDPEFEEQMKALEEGMGEYKNALHQLAK